MGLNNCELGAISMIGIKGHAGSGKTTVANMLKLIIDYYVRTSKIANYDYYMEYKNFPINDNYVKVYNFADSLKKELAIKLGIPDSVFYDDKAKQDYAYSFTRRVVFNRKDGFDKTLQPSFVDLHDWLAICNSAGYPDNHFDYYIPIRLLMQEYGTEINRGIFGSNVWVNKLDEEIRRDNKEVAIIGDVRFINESDYIYNNKGKCIVVRRGTPKIENVHSSEMVTIALDDIVIDNNKTIKELFNNVITVFRNYLI